MFENYTAKKTMYEGIVKVCSARELPRPKIQSLEGHLWAEPLSSQELKGKY